MKMGIEEVCATAIAKEIKNSMPEIMTALKEAVRDEARTMLEATAKAEWQSSSAFCHLNGISSQTLRRYCRDGKVEALEITPKQKYYRWRTETPKKRKNARNGL